MYDITILMLYRNHNILFIREELNELICCYKNANY